MPTGTRSRCRTARRIVRSGAKVRALRCCGRDLGDFEDGEGGAIATLAEIEADEEFALERVAQVLRHEVVVAVEDGAGAGGYGSADLGFLEDGVGGREELAHVFLAEVIAAEVAEFLCRGSRRGCGSIRWRGLRSESNFRRGPIRDRRSRACRWGC